MKKTITISIPSPCSQKWENFSQTEFGGFCTSCSKAVIDFTGMSDEGIVKYFKSRPSGTCGRLRNDQLKSYSLDLRPSVSPGLSLLKVGMLSMLLLLSVKPVLAQVKKLPATEAVETIVVEPVVEDEKEFTVRGVVKSLEDGSAMPGVNVYMKSDVSIGTVTDAEGRFEFPKKLKKGEVILFTYIGFQSQEYAVPAYKIDNADIKLLIEMNYDVVGMLGEISTNEVYKVPPALQKVWLKVKSVF